MVEWCTNKNDAVSFVGYDIQKWIWNTLHDAVSASLIALKLINENIHFVLPSGVVIPIITDGVISFAKLPERTFWAIRVKMAGVTVLTQGLPKTPLRNIWDAFVAPFDLFIEGSEYWPFLDRSDGTVKQGLAFTPVRKFGVLTDGPFLFRDIAIIGTLLTIMHKLKLDVLAYNFMKSIVVGIKQQIIAYKQKALKKVVDHIDAQLDVSLTSVSEDVSQLIGDLTSAINKVDTVHELVDVLDNGVKDIKAMMGVRLLLR